MTQLAVSTVTDRSRPSDAAAIVGAVQHYADTVLRPGAVSADTTPVSADRITELRRIGALNHLAGPEWGGASATRAQDHRINEIVAAACFNTWLIWTQHSTSVGFVQNAIAERADVHTGHSDAGSSGSDVGSSASGSVVGSSAGDSETVAPGRAESPVTGPLAAAVLRGERLAGAALSDVRRYPDRYLAATRTDGGWLVSGRVSWFSGWGLAELAIVGAVTEDARVVIGIADLSTAGSAVTAEPLDLTGVGGSRTVALHLDGLFVADDEVLSVSDREEWQLRDEQQAVAPKPQLFALLDELINALAAEQNPAARELAEAWRDPVAELRREIYTLADEAAAHGADDLFAERLALRVRSTTLLADLSRALLAARAGRGLLRGDVAQRLGAFASFLQVQSQTLTLRTAQLRSIPGARLS
ncbi:MAG: hypothetical protein ACTJHU_00020 [Mycetocola sp.]